MKVLMCDPPGGWMYGFPKPIHEEFYILGDDFDLARWLVSEGYPEEEVDQYDGNVPCRYWEVETNENGESK